jgi:Tol biopolymer transport system component
VSSTGAQGNFQSFSPSLSRDGRFVAFRSSATTLVTGKATGWVYIFRHDLQTGETIRVETDLSTVPTAGYTPALSEDGSVVAFATVAPLSPADTNGILDVYAFDFDSGQATLASVATSGSGGNGISGHASAFTGVLGISGNGRIVAFPSEATDLVSGDTNGIRDTFVRDLDAEATERVSVSSSGAQGDATGAQNWVPATSLSRSGRYVGFVSRSSNLVEGDTNGTRDVFRRDRLSGQTDRVSLTDAGAQAAGENTDVWLSADGSRIAFTSFAKLVDQDTNGALDVYVRYSSTCPSGSDDGVVTGIVHEQVEPLAGDSAPTVHEIGCAINATTGL